LILILAVTASSKGRSSPVVDEILDTAFGVLEGMNAFGQMPESIVCILDTANLKKKVCSKLGIFAIQLLPRR